VLFRNNFFYRKNSQIVEGLFIEIPICEVAMLEVVVFLCGAVVMILEMVGSRILAPYLGSSIIVWTSLIGIILGSLSIGYWWGGQRADKNPNHRSLSLIIVLASFLVGVIAISKSFVLDFLQDSTSNIHLASVIATSALFAPPSILLGMVSPYAVKLKLMSLEKSGKTVGRLYAISTIGSIFGTFLGGFYLIAFFGSTRILCILAITLAATSFVAFLGDRLLKFSALALFIVLMAAAGSYEGYLASQGFHDVDTNYNRIIVYDTKTANSDTIRIMTTHPKAMQSAMKLDSPKELLLPYCRYFDLVSWFKPEASSFLMLGGGGYSYPKYALDKYPKATMDVVEIDPKVTELARRFFLLEDDPRLTVIHEDARCVLRKSSKRYDAILIDVFNSHYSVPFHLTTLETAKAFHERLADDGVVIVNILSGIDGREGRFLRAEYATYKAVFSQVLIFPVFSSDNGTTWQNVMLVASKSERVPDIPGVDSPLHELISHIWKKPVGGDVPILTDDFAPVDSYIAF
jgi:predicted membrane-bound spermidine synthase